MATNPDPIVILSYARTPMGSFQGALSGVARPSSARPRSRRRSSAPGLKGDDVDKVFMGNVLPAGLGQAPARQAALGAGLPRSAEAVTVNKVCGSGMQAAIFAHDMLDRRLGRRDRRRRHGEHVQRAISVEEVPLGRAHRPRHGLRPYDARRARGRL